MSFVKNVKYAKTVAGLMALSGAAYVGDVIFPPWEEAGRVAVGLTVVTAAVYLGGCIDSAVAKIRVSMDETLGVAAQFGRDSERRRAEAGGVQLATVSQLPHGKGGKR